MYQHLFRRSTQSYEVLTCSSLTFIFLNVFIFAILSFVRILIWPKIKAYIRSWFAVQCLKGFSFLILSIVDNNDSSFKLLCPCYVSNKISYLFTFYLVKLSDSLFLLSLTKLVIWFISSQHCRASRLNWLQGRQLHHEFVIVKSDAVNKINYFWNPYGSQRWKMAILHPLVVSSRVWPNFITFNYFLIIINNKKYIMNRLLWYKIIIKVINYSKF